MVMVMAIVLSATAAVAAAVQCSGGRCEGTPQRDRITGSTSADDIIAKGSADIVRARAGNDVVKLGGGGTPFDMEFVEGGRGDDVLRGGNGSDELDDFVPRDINDT